MLGKGDSEGKEMFEDRGSKREEDFLKGDSTGEVGSEGGAAMVAGPEWKIFYFFFGEGVVQVGEEVL